MTRHSFIWSLLAMVLAPLGLRAVSRHSLSANYHTKLHMEDPPSPPQTTKWSTEIDEWDFVEVLDPATFYWVNRE